MRRMWLLLLFLLGPTAAAGACPGELPPGDGEDPRGVPTAITVRLEPRTATAKRGLGYSRRRRLQPSPTPPADLVRAPEGDRVHYARLELDPRAGGAVDLALSGVTRNRLQDRLFVDANRNLDFTDDGPGHKIVTRAAGARTRAFVPGLRIPRGKKLPDFTLSVTLWWNPADALIACQANRSVWREGSLTLGARRMLVALIDDDNDGVYSLGERDSWSVAPEEDPAGLLDGAKVSSTRTPQEIDVGTLRLQAMKPDGSLVHLQWEPTPQSTDPKPVATRPRAKKRPSWVDDESVALSRMKKEKKRGLFFLCSAEDEASRKLDDVFGDREVARLISPLVVARILDPVTGSAVARKAGVRTVPALVLVRSDGTPVATRTGATDAATLERWLNDNLASKTP